MWVVLVVIELLRSWLGPRFRFVSIKVVRNVRDVTVALVANRVPIQSCVQRVPQPGFVSPPRSRVDFQV